MSIVIIHFYQVKLNENVKFCLVLQWPSKNNVLISTIFLLSNTGCKLNLTELRQTFSCTKKIYAAKQSKTVGFYNHSISYVWMNAVISSAFEQLCSNNASPDLTIHKGQMHAGVLLFHQKINSNLCLTNQHDTDFTLTHPGISPTRTQAADEAWDVLWESLLKRSSSERNVRLNLI